MKNSSKTHKLKIIWPPAIVMWVLQMITMQISMPQNLSSWWIAIGFVIGIALASIIPTFIAYVIYRFGLSKDKDNIKKLWLSFGMVYALIITTTLMELFNINP